MDAERKLLSMLSYTRTRGYRFLPFYQVENIFLFGFYNLDSFFVVITDNLFLSRMNVMKPQRLWVDDEESLSESNLRMDRPTVIYVHGFTEQANGKGSTTIKNGKVCVCVLRCSEIEAENIWKFRYIPKTTRMQNINAKA